MFAYCGNNPVIAVDYLGRSFMLLMGAIGATVGAITGSLIAASNGQDILAGAVAGAVAGGLTGLGLGAAAGIALAGSALATTASVVTGASALGTTVMTSGVTAGALVLAENIAQAVQHTPQIFWSGGDVVKNYASNFARQINGITLEMTSLG